VPGNFNERLRSVTRNPWWGWGKRRGWSPDAGGLRAAGPEAQETDVEPGMEPGGRGCTKCEDEGWRAHLAHQAERAVDLDTGVVAAVTLQVRIWGHTTTLDVTQRRGEHGGGGVSRMGSGTMARRETHAH
jgi:hypothetical protein